MNKANRKRTIETLTGYGVPEPEALKLLRYSATLHRYAELRCDGGFPFESGDSDRDRSRMVTCPTCETTVWRSSLAPSPLRCASTVKGKMVQECPDCRTEARVSILVDQLKSTVPALKRSCTGLDPRSGSGIVLVFDDGSKWPREVYL